MQATPPLEHAIEFGCGVCEVAAAVVAGLKSSHQSSHVSDDEQPTHAGRVETQSGQQARERDARERKESKRQDGISSHGGSGDGQARVAALFMRFASNILFLCVVAVKAFGRAAASAENPTPPTDARRAWAVQETTGQRPRAREKKFFALVREQCVRLDGRPSSRTHPVRGRRVCVCAR